MHPLDLLLESVQFTFDFLGLIVPRCHFNYNYIAPHLGCRSCSIMRILLIIFSLLRCFDRFFKAVNSKEGKLVLKRRVYLMDDDDLIGVDYVWRVSEWHSGCVVVSG